MSVQGQPNNGGSGDDQPAKGDSPDKIIHDYFLERDAEFRRLAQLREKVRYSSADNSTISMRLISEPGMGKYSAGSKVRAATPESGQC